MISKIRIILIFSISIWSKPQIAVLTFEGDKSSTQEQRSAISDRFQSELMKTDSFMVLDRSNMSKILKEQDFQQSGACTESSCQVQIGQLLGVEKLVTGNVVNFGKAWSINAKLLDVTTGQVIRAESIEMEGELFTLLSKGCPVLAHRIAGESIIQSSNLSYKKAIVQTQKWGGLALAVLGAGLAYWADTQVSSANKAAKEPLNYDEYKQKLSQADSYAMQRSVYAGLSAVGLLGFGLSFAF